MGRRIISFKKIFVILASLMLSAAILPSVASAYPLIDTATPVSLTVSMEDDGTPISGMQFSFYKVAKVDNAANFIALSDFDESKTHVSLSRYSSEDWTSRALALEGYVQNNNMEADLTGTTESDGTITFDSAGVSQGLYLLIGDTFTKDETKYTPQAMLVSLPYLMDDDTWDYNPVLSLKYDKVTEPVTSPLYVIKKWDDDENAQGLRPDNVNVTLLKDGEVFESVELTSTDSWTYVWQDMDMTAQWTIVEENCPDGYTYGVERDGDSFILTNTLETQEPSSTEQPSTTQPAESSSAATPTRGSGTSGGSGTTKSTTAAESEKLPQTGQLWWPVSFLLVGGAALILIGGIVRSRKSAG